MDRHINKLCKKPPHIDVNETITPVEALIVNEIINNL